MILLSPRRISRLLSACLTIALLTALSVGSLSGRTEAAEKPPLEGRLEGNFTLFDPPIPVPLDRFEDENGNLLSLGDFEGKVLLVNFWATWCAPCVHEMPSLDRLQARFEDQAFQVVTLSEDRAGADKVLPFMAKLSLHNLPPYIDPKTRMVRAFKVRGLPTSFLVDAEGQVVGRLIGPYDWDRPEVDKLIQFYLDRAY